MAITTRLLCLLNLSAHGRGKECKHDFDGDEVKDKNDACPKDATLSVVNFENHFVFRPNGNLTKNSAIWKIENKGRLVRKERGNDNSVLIG